MSHPDAYRNWKNCYNQQQRQKYPVPLNVYSRPPTPAVVSPRLVATSSPPPLATSSPIRRHVSSARTPAASDYSAQRGNVSMASIQGNYNRSGAAPSTPWREATTPQPSANRGDHRRSQYDQHRQQLQHQPASCHRPPQEDSNQLLRRLFLQKNVDISHSVKLGAGRYSKVITARLYENMETGVYTKIAIKIINKEKVTKDFKEKFLPREIECWRQLRHPNLVRILGHYEALKYVFLSMEFGDKGDLLSYVQKNGPAPADGQARTWLRQILAGVGHMHGNRIAHRDLKLENCILFGGNIVKVADFGFARKINYGVLSHTYCGSKSYSPPEILLGRPYNPYKADVWSIGVIGFILVTDTMPFRENMHNHKIVENQRRREYSYPLKLNIPQHCQEALDEMMTFDQLLRPSCRNCLRLPYFANEARR